MSLHNFLLYDAAASAAGDKGNAVHAAVGAPPPLLRGREGWLGERGSTPVCWRCLLAHQGTIVRVKLRTLFLV